MNPDLSQLSDFERNLVEQARAAAAANNGGAPATPQPGSPQAVTLNIGGKPMTFASQKDLEDAMNAVLVESNNQIRTAQELALNAQKTGASATPAPVTPPDDFKNRFFAAMDADPEAALDMYMDRRFLGKEAGGQSIEALRQAAIGTVQNTQLAAVNQFRSSNPEFNPQQGPALDQIRTSLNLPITPEGLDAAYAYGLKRGVFNVPAPTQFQQQPIQQQSYNAYNQPVLQAGIPTPGRFGSPQNSQPDLPALDPYVQNTLESLSSEQLATLMRSQGMNV